MAFAVEVALITFTGVGWRTWRTSWTSPTSASTASIVSIVDGPDVAGVYRWPRVQRLPAGPGFNGGRPNATWATVGVEGCQVAPPVKTVGTSQRCPSPTLFFTGAGGQGPPVAHVRPCENGGYGVDVAGG